MSIEFRCPGCNTLMQVGGDAAGRKARCPGCRTVVSVPAAEAPAPAAKEPGRTRRDRAEPAAAPEAEAVSQRRTEKPRKQPAARSRRFAEEDDDDESRPRRGPPKQSSLGPVVLLVGVGVFVLGCLSCLGVGGWVLYNQATPPPPPVAGNGPDRPLGPVEGGGGMAPGPEGNQPQPDRPFGPPQGEGMPPGPGGKPPQQGEPTRVALVNGKFEVQVGADANLQDAARYQFEAKADTVYRVQVNGNPWVSARVAGRVGPLPQPRDRFGNELRQDFAFLSGNGGAFTVIVERPPPGSRLTIREMDGSEPLPEHVKLTPAGVDLPQLAKVQELDVYAKKFSGAAFAPDNKSFWMAHDDGTLSFWEHPAPLLRGSYVTKEALVALGVDRKGRLYAQSTKDRGAISPGQRTVGDILVWDSLRPDKEKLPLPPPAQTIQLGGVVQRFISAPDGRWLYFLDVHNRKLGRIDPEKAAIDKEVGNLTAGTRAFCLTPDGKTIYCCSDSNSIDVIDANEFKRTRAVALDRGQPTDIAATNEGLVFLVGQRVQVDPALESNCLLVDLTRDVPAPAKVMPLEIGTYCQFVRLLPDQRAALFSGDRRVIACSLPSRPALFRAVTRELFVRDYFMPGQVYVSPDGRTLLYDAAVILSVSR